MNAPPCGFPEREPARCGKSCRQSYSRYLFSEKHLSLSFSLSNRFAALFVFPVQTLLQQTVLPPLFVFPVQTLLYQTVLPPYLFSPFKLLP
jgi:hypothetical protein